MASWPLVGCYGPQLFHTDAAWRGCWKGAAPLEAGLQRRACFCLEHWLKQEKGIILSFWRADITFFVLKLDFFEKKQKTDPCKHDSWRETWMMLQEPSFLWKWLFYTNVNIFWKRSKQDVLRGPLFLVSLSRGVLFAAVFSFGTKGIVDIFLAILISWLCSSPKQELIG